MKEQTVNETFMQGVKACIPTLLGYASIGFAAGIVGVSSGLSPLEVVLFALILYAGSAQFIVSGLIVAGVPLVPIVITVFVVNLRHFLLSMSVAPTFKKYSLLENVGIGALLTDETFGVVALKIQNNENIKLAWMNGLNICAYLSWAIFCLLGALLGAVVTDPHALGLDFALVAMFVALLVLQVQSLPRNKILHSLVLMGCMGILMYILCHFMASYMAVLIATIITATIGVVSEK